MSVLITPDEMRAAEAAAVASGRTEPDLMRAAAEQIAAWVDSNVRRRATSRRFAVALVGPGNNGGDALVALAILIDRGWRCAAVCFRRAEMGTLPATDETLHQIEMSGLEVLDAADVILDGVYGISGRASLSDDVAEAFRRAREVRIDHGTPLIAIDVPSGTDPGSGEASQDAFQADVTLCLGLPKIGLVREPAATHVGELEVLDIGIAPPPEERRPRLIDEPTIRRMLPRRRASAHKHQTGAVLVIGGAPAYYGAPRLSAEAAARAGAGLVCVAAPASIVPVIAAQVPELVFLPLDESPSRASEQIGEWIQAHGGHVDAIVVGPGLGQDPFAPALLDRLFGVDGITNDPSSARDSKPTFFVLDADCLNWIAKRGWLPVSIRGDRVVMTPHAGELSRLMGTSIDVILDDPVSFAQQAAGHFDATVILKTGYSVAASPDGGVWLAPRAAPELAAAGTGDVLAGLVGGLLAQGLQPLDAARAGLFVGARAGKLARRERGTLGLVARDVIEHIPKVLRTLSEPMWDCGDCLLVREEL